MKVRTVRYIEGSRCAKFSNWFVGTVQCMVGMSTGYIFIQKYFVSRSSRTSETLQKMPQPDILDLSVDRLIFHQ